MDSSSPKFSVRKLALVLAGAVAVALLTVVLTLQPRGTRPGFWLRGDLVTERVTDWAFTNQHEEIFVQTRTSHLLPHSNTIWCVEEDGQLFVGSYDRGADHRMFWVENLRHGHDVRLKIGTGLYDVRLERVEDAELTERLYQVLLRKYNPGDYFQNRLGRWWFYRVQQR